MRTETRHRHHEDESHGRVAIRATLIVTPKGSADSEPGAKVLNQVFQMDGQAVARALPAEHQLIADAWGGSIFAPSMVYMPEKNRLLLHCLIRPQPSSVGVASDESLLIHSDDYGETWSHVRLRTDGANPNAPGVTLSYLGDGMLLTSREESGEGASAFSGDYGHTWRPFPSSHTASGFPFCMWDPCLADRNHDTGALKRIIASGFSQGMERQFDEAKRLVTLPNKWHWKHDPQDRGLVERWHRDASFVDWPRMMRIDQHWTLQGEPAGVGWYATDFEMPETGGTALAILFGAVDGICDVFIDGTKVGEQKKSPEVMWSRPFHVSLRKGLSAGPHTLVVRVQKESAPESNAGIYLPVAIVEDNLGDTPREAYSWPRQNALLRFSFDSGHTWPEEVHPPSWNGSSGVGVNEVALCRAANGDLFAACRIVHPDYYGGKSDPDRHTTIDHYCGLGTSVSSDDGYTWSQMNVLYEYGHMHPSIVVMPDDTLVMTYVVRMGALKKQHRMRDTDGYSQWSVEAIVSPDHGRTWDVSSRYVLGAWSGGCQSQSTSTVLLPDGSLLTAFGSGYLSPATKVDILLSREVCLVRWRPESA